MMKGPVAVWSRHCRLDSVSVGGGFIPRLAIFSVLACALFSCDKSTTPANPLVQHGRAVYQANCTSCHNPNPKLPGSVGPEIYGSSKELIEARVLRADYPAGYRPKRKTKMMPALPQLRPEIDALFAYLNSP